MTRAAGCLVGLVVCIATTAAPAMAQDEPRFALVASLPSPTISLQWELSEKFALRVEGSYSYREEAFEEFPNTSSGASEHVYANGTSSVIFTDPSVLTADILSESSLHSGSLAIAGIFTMYRSDRLRLYGAPRVSGAWSRQRFSLTIPPLRTLSGTPALSPLAETYTQSSTSPGAGAFFGAATTVHRHVALFGEVGASYTRSDSPIRVSRLDSPGSGDSKSTAIGTRAVAGVMLLF